MNVKIFSLSLAFALAAPAATIVNVAIDTSSLSSTAGGIYLQFNPGLGTSDPAQASLTNFTLAAPGTFSGSPAVTGAVTGVLPATVTLANTNALNDYFHALTFGTLLSFRVTIDVPTVSNATGGSVFNFVLTSSDGLSNLFNSTDPDGYLFRLDVNPAGTVSRSNFNTDLVAFDSAVPEPATTLMVLSAVLMAWKRRGSRRGNLTAQTM